jgi:hypothetical protein
VTMQLFVRRYCTMIAAPVQCDVDGIPKGSHYVRVPPMGWTSRDAFTLADRPWFARAHARCSRDRLTSLRFWCAGHLLTRAVSCQANGPGLRSNPRQQHTLVDPASPSLRGDSTRPRGPRRLSEAGRGGVGPTAGHRGGQDREHSTFRFNKSHKTARAGSSRSIPPRRSGSRAWRGVSTRAATTRKSVGHS